MHLKAITIKEQLLGPEDYEVALSVGHLASLYNYDMMKFDQAEQLYLRSIAIGKYYMVHSLKKVSHASKVFFLPLRHYTMREEGQQA